MSTLCEPVVAVEAEIVCDYQYPAIAPPEFFFPREASQAESEIRLERARAAAIAAAHEQGVREGEQKAAAGVAHQVEQARMRVAEAVSQFAAERREYFRRVEADVVTLALAIARKLLHREAQIDPLLLSGVVRVALEQMQAGSEVVLRAAPDQHEDWQRFLAALPEANREVTVLADEAAEPGTVLLETAAGKAEFNLEEQLKEIESGFLDLLRREVDKPDESPAVELS